MDSESEGARLRTHIRMLGDLLGQTLARQEGDALLEMVESVRLAVRSDTAAAATVLAVSYTHLTLPTILLV